MATPFLLSEGLCHAARDRERGRGEWRSRQTPSPTEQTHCKDLKKSVILLFDGKVALNNIYRMNMLTLTQRACAEPAWENVMNAHRRNPFISCCC
jgi:hypothetical protein